METQVLDSDYATGKEGAIRPLPLWEVELMETHWS